MKYSVVLILASLLFTVSSFAQTNGNTNYSLLVQKVTNGSPRNLVFKPNHPIKIKTTKGDKISGSHYSLSEDFIFIHSEKNQNKTDTLGYTTFSEAHVTDSIALSNIEWIKGKVFKDGGRKALGGLVIIGGTTFLFIPIVVAAWGAVGIAVAFTIPIVALIIEGGRIMGARKFRIPMGWEVKTLQ